MEKTIETKLRDNSFDVLRAIGIIFMVMGHVGFGDYFSQYIHAFHMPIFFFVSGYFYKKDKYNSYFKYLVHDLKTLIVPYVVFFLICQPLHYIWTGHFDIKYAILSFFTSNHNRIDVAGGFWFLLCLFTLKQIFYFINKIKIEWVKWIIIIPLSILGSLFNNQIDIILPLCLDSALSCLPIIYLGYLFKRYRESKFIVNTLKLPIWATLILLILNGIFIILNAYVNVRVNHYGILPLFWINVILALFVWYRISLAISNCEFKIIKKCINVFCYIGKNSVVFFLMNELVIFAVAKVLSFIPSTNEVIYYLIQIAIFIITMLILALVNYIIEKTKIFKWVIGK